jgi:flagella basal body P-ring formation protein FlgA
MTRTSLLALTCLAASALIAPQALASDAVVLRETLLVDGAHITLGDLFTVDGEAADIVVARAPEPGGRTSLTVEYVRRITVARDSQVIDAATLTDLLEGELFAEEGRVHEVRLSNTAMALHAPVDATGGLQVESLNFDPRSGMLVADITPYDGAQSVRITGRAYATVDVPVLARAIPAGAEISDADIEWVSLRSDRLRPDSLLDPDSIIGLETRRALRPGEPLRGYDLQRPLMIERGELVTLVFEAPGIQLSVRARAMENAADGEVARFVNLQSSRTVEALVDGPGRARVGASPAASF